LYRIVSNNMVISEQLILKDLLVSHESRPTISCIGYMFQTVFKLPTKRHNTL
jgi:hypothetical protein